MTNEDKRNLGLLGLLVLLLWNRPVVTTSISFPKVPEGETCYDPETDSYYVGECEGQWQ